MERNNSGGLSAEETKVHYIKALIAFDGEDLIERARLVELARTLDPSFAVFDGLCPPGRSRGKRVVWSFDERTQHARAMQEIALRRSAKMAEFDQLNRARGAA